MKKMSANEMSMLNGGKSKKCGGCGKTYKTWLTYNYHVFFKGAFADCLAYVITHSW